jgi:hypothetical protein
MVPNLPCFFYGSSGEGISFRWNHNLSWKVRFLLGKRTEKLVVMEYQSMVLAIPANLSIGEVNK